MGFAAIIESTNYHCAYFILLLDYYVILINQFATLHLTLKYLYLSIKYILTTILCSNLSILSKLNLIFTIDYLTKLIYIPKLILRKLDTDYYTSLRNTMLYQSINEKLDFYTIHHIIYQHIWKT